MEHINIPEGQIHEPKGITLSASNRVYIANGAGSGSWQQVDASTLQGVISNSTAADRLVITNGSGGFTSREASLTSDEVVYGVVLLTTELDEINTTLTNLQNQISDLEGRVAALETP